MWVVRAQHRHHPTLARWANTHRPPGWARLHALWSLTGMPESPCATRKVRPRFGRPKRKSPAGHRSRCWAGSPPGPWPRGHHDLSGRRPTHPRGDGFQGGHPLRPGSRGIFSKAHTQAPVTPIPGLGLTRREPQTVRSRLTSGQSVRKLAPNARKSRNSLRRAPATFGDSARGPKGSPRTHSRFGPHGRKFLVAETGSRISSVGCPAGN